MTPPDAPGPSELEQRDELELLQRGLAILEEREADEVLEHLAALAAETGGMASAGIAVVEASAEGVPDPPSERFLTLVAGTGRFGGGPAPIPAGHHLLSAVPHEGRGFYDLRETPGWPERLSGPLAMFRTLIVLPVDSAYSRGVLLLGDESPGQASARVMERLRRLRTLIREGLLRRDLQATAERERQAEQARRESERFSRTLLGNLPGVVYRVQNNPEWTVEFISESCSDLLGYQAAEFFEPAGPGLGELIHPDDREAVWQKVQAALSAGETAYHTIFRIRTREGAWKWVWERGRFVFDDDGAWVRLEGFLADITELKRTETELAEERLLARITLDAMGEYVVRCGADGRVQFVNAAFEEAVGRSAADLIGEPLTEVVRLWDERTDSTCPLALEDLEATEATEVEERQLTLAAEGGARLPVEVSAFRSVHSADGTRLGTVLVLREVSAARRRARRLAYQANHDALTGAANRYAFEQRLEELVEDAAVQQRTHTLLYLDLDRFKEVNDRAGHQAGDELLVQLCRSLQQQLRGGDVLGRLGGDEFGVLLEGHDRTSARIVAERLLECVRTFRFEWRGMTFDPAVSIGVAEIAPSTPTPEEALRSADAACFEAKHAGRNRIRESAS